MSAEVALVIPPSNYDSELNYQNVIDCPPEGIWTLWGCLDRLGIECDVIDCRQTGDPEKFLLESLNDQTKLVGFTTFFDSFAFIERASLAVKREFGRATLLAGGPLATNAYSCFLLATDMDAVVCGEGEKAWEALAVNRERLAGRPAVQGVIWRDNQQDAQRGEIYRDLDDLPDLNWSFLTDDQKRSQKSFMYSISRGCKNRCRYCTSVFRTMRSKSPRKVARDIKYLVDEYSMESIIINDSDFLYKQVCLDYLHIFKEYDIKWSCFSRPEGLTPGLLKQLADANCVNIRIGIDAFDQNVLDLNHRNIDVETMERNIQLLLDSDIPLITCYFILDIAGQTEETLNQIVRFAEENEKVLPRAFFYIKIVNHDEIRNSVEYSISHLRSLEDYRYNISNNSETTISLTYLYYINWILSEITTTRSQQRFELQVPA